MSLYHKAVSGLFNLHQKYIPTSKQHLLRGVLCAFLPYFNPIWLHEEGKLERIKNLYVSQGEGAIKIEDLLSLREDDDFVINCFPPRYLSPYYRLKIYNRLSREIRIENISPFKPTPLLQKYKSFILQ